MPARRRTARRLVETADPGVKFCLLHGGWYGDPSTHEYAEASGASWLEILLKARDVTYQRQLWDELRETELPLWTRTRPRHAAVVLVGYSAPERRRQVGGGRTRTNGSVPTWAWGLPEYDAVPVDPRDPPIFESEPAFLERHDLLTADERRRLRAEDFAPVTIGGGDE